jgi:uncharacterized protein (TIRG00374 family)
MLTKNKTVLFLKAIFSIAFFAVLIRFVQGQELLAVFSHVNWLYFTLSFLMFVVLFILSCLKWKILLDAGGRGVPFSRLSAIYLVGNFFSNLLPSTVGGDVVRSFYAGKEISSQQYAAVTVFIERFSGLLFLLVLVIFAPLLKPSLYANAYIYIPALCSFLLLSVVFWSWIASEPFSFIKSASSSLLAALNQEGKSQKTSLGNFLMIIERFLRTLFSRLERFSGELGKALKVLKYDKVLLGKVVALTMLFYCLTWLNVYFTFLAFDIHVDFLAIIALVPTIMFVAHLPVSILGNLGFFESVFVVYFLLAGVSGAETLAMGLLLRLKTLCFGVVGFLVYLLYKHTWGVVVVDKES